MFDTLQEELESLAPGPHLAAVLARIDVSVLSGYDQVVVLRAARRMASHYAAVGYAAMAAISETMHEMFDGDVELAWRAAATEIRAALTFTRRTADVELDLAWCLYERLPTVWEALAEGVVDVPKARVIVHATSHLTVETARDVADQVLEDAAGLTTGQLRARITKLCISADPDDAKKRYNTAVEGRRVVVEATPDETVNSSQTWSSALPNSNLAAGEATCRPTGPRPSPAESTPWPEV